MTWWVLSISGWRFRAGSWGIDSTAALVGRPVQLSQWWMEMVGTWTKAWTCTIQRTPVRIPRLKGPWMLKRPDVHKIALSIKSRCPPPRKKCQFWGFSTDLSCFPHFGLFGGGGKPNFAGHDFYEHPDFSEGMLISFAMSPRDPPILTGNKARPWSVPGLPCLDDPPSCDRYIFNTWVTIKENTALHATHRRSYMHEKHQCAPRSQKPQHPRPNLGCRPCAAEVLEPKRRQKRLTRSDRSALHMWTKFV